MYDAGFKDIPVVSLSINGIEKMELWKCHSTTYK